MDQEIHDTPSDVDHAGGTVQVSGPDGVAISMTPEAAAATGDRLIRHAAAAKGEEELARDIERRRLAPKDFH